MYAHTPKRTPTLPYRTQAYHDSTLPQAHARSPTPMSPPAPSVRHVPTSLSLLAFASIGSRNELPPPANHDLHVSHKSSRHLQPPCHVSCHVPPTHSTTYSSPLIHSHQNAHQLTSIVHKQTMTPPPRHAHARQHPCRLPHPLHDTPQPASRFSRSYRLALTTNFLRQQTMTSTPVASLHAICNLHAMSVVASHSTTTPACFSTRKKEGARLDKVASTSPVAATAEWRLVPIIGGSFPH